MKFVTRTAFSVQAHRWFCIFVLFLFFSSSAPVFAQESSMELQQIEQKTALAETKIQQLKSVQAQILAKQTQIMKELDSLKIWIRRNRG